MNVSNVYLLSLLRLILFSLRCVHVNTCYKRNIICCINNEGCCLYLRHTHIHFTNYVPFHRRKVLQLSSGVDEPGTIKWDLCLCLLLAWIVVYFCIWKGIKSSGKVKLRTKTHTRITHTNIQLYILPLSNYALLLIKTHTDICIKQMYIIIAYTKQSTQIHIQI